MERHLKHWFLPEFRCRKHQTHPHALFSPLSFLLREKRWGRRRRVRNDHDGTNPCKQGFLSSVLVSSFPNRKLNLRFGFFYANLQQPLSQPSAASLPTPFVPSGHFPLIGGIGPRGWKAKAKPSPFQGEGGAAKPRRMRGKAASNLLVCKKCVISYHKC